MKPLRFPTEDLDRLRSAVTDDEDDGLTASQRWERQRKAARQQASKTRENRLLRQVPARYQTCTLESWQGAEDARAKAESWDPAESWALVCFGRDNGVGKTHLATAIWRRHAANLRPAYWWSTGPLLRSIYDAFRTNTAAEVEQRVAKAGLLLLDDLGRQHRSSEDARARLVTILCERYDWQRPTVITTNLTEAALAEWDPALADRIYSSESVIVGRQGESWRRR